MTEGYSSPVGTDEERNSGIIWPGFWFDALPYLYQNNGAYHTGADLNLNDPTHNSDAGMPVHAIGAGRVIFAGDLGGSWGNVVVIHHNDAPVVYSRCAHLARLDVSAGNTVNRGDVIGTIGTMPGWPGHEHLHFDISYTHILVSQPGHWPISRAGVLANYVNPKVFLQTHNGDENTMTLPTGKMIMAWQIKNIANGNAAQAAQDALAMGLTTINVKVANGTDKYNRRWNGIKWVDDILLPWVNAMRAVGLKIWGWQYIYGNNPVAEAEVASVRINELGLDGFDVDAESHIKGKAQQAAQYMALLRGANPNLPIGLSSYRYPAVHSDFPWSSFWQYINYGAPQVYWNPPNPVYNYGPVPELQLSHYQWQLQRPGLPFIPTGRAYIGDGHPNPLPGELTDFMTQAQSMGLPGISFWSWEHLYYHAGGAARMQAIADFEWTVTPPPLTLEERVTILESMAHTHPEG